MKLSSIIDKHMIFFDIEGVDRETVYRSMVKKILKINHFKMSEDELTKGLIDREDSICIPWEASVALPHLRSSNLEDLYVAIGVLRQPVKLKGCDKTETQIIVMSFISEKTSDIYLKSLSAFSRYLINRENLDKLLACDDAEAFLNQFDQDNVQIKKNITAEDIMETEFSFVKDDARVRDALDLFTKKSKVQLPVLDKNNNLAGILDARAIVKRAVPEYIMMMDNLKFLTSFDSFEELINRAEELMVKDFIREPIAVMSPSTPLIQLTVFLLKNDKPNIFVMEEGSNKLLGIITMQEIINKVLRG